MEQEKRDSVKSLGKALQLIDIINQARTPMTLMSLSQVSGFPKSTVYALLNTLRSYDCIRQGSDGRYYLGTRLFEWGCGVSASWELNNVARPYANINISDVQSMNFYTRDQETGYFTSFSLAELLQSRRYYFEDLPAHLIPLYDEDGNFQGYDDSEAWQYAIEVRPMLALEDSWVTYEVGTEHVSEDFNSMGTANRFRLLFGQTSPTESRTNQTAKYVYAVNVVLDGQPEIVEEMKPLEGSIGSHKTSMTLSVGDLTILKNLQKLLRFDSSDGTVLKIDGWTVMPDSTYDLTDKSLFTAWEATDDKDDYGYPDYRAWLNPEAFSGGGGCGGGSVKEGDYVLFYAGAAPTFTYGEAKGNPVLTLSVTGCDGKVEAIDIYKSDLLELADTGVVVYQFWPPVEGMGGGANAIVGTKFVTIEKLLNAYGVDTFAAGDTLTVIPNDNKNLSVNKTELDTCKYYFDADGVRNDVPAALLLSWNSGKLVDKDGKVLTTVEELANSAYDSGNIRFGYGVSQEQYDNRSTTGLRGMRLVSNVATLSFTQAHAYVDVPADAGDKYLASAATCTENAKYYTKVCANANCNAMAEPAEKAGTALGHKWGNGVETVLPTIDKEGVMTYTCSVCSTTKTEPIAKLSDSETDQSAANEVINLINSIGKVSKSSKDAIEVARKAYNALTAEQQALVKASGALKTLQKAEITYRQLTTSGSSSGSTSGSASDGKNGATDKTVKSGRTGDMGIAVYVGLSLLSLTGGAWAVKKNRKVR